jgi:hypothetical protein
VFLSGNPENVKLFMGKHTITTALDNMKKYGRVRTLSERKVMSEY